MEIVLLAQITLNRIGSAGSGGGFSSQRAAKFQAEVADSDPTTLRSLVIEIAENNGEALGVLEGLQIERGYGGATIFNIQGRNTFYSTAYAECQVIHALKANGRYFELQTVDDKGATPFTPSRVQT